MLPPGGAWPNPENLVDRFTLGQNGKIAFLLFCHILREGPRMQSVYLALDDGAFLA